MVGKAPAMKHGPSLCSDCLEDRTAFLNLGGLAKAAGGLAGAAGAANGAGKSMLIPEPKET